MLRSASNIYLGNIFKIYIEMSYAFIIINNDAKNKNSNHSKVHFKDIEDMMIL